MGYCKVTNAVDEADKCPLEVVCVLKSLVDGEMTLSDGRKILNLQKFPHSLPLPGNPLRFVVTIQRTLFLVTPISG